MNIIELKPGYLVQLRNKEFYMVMPEKDHLVLAKCPRCENNTLVNTWLSISSCDDITDYNVMKIYGTASYAHQVFNFSTTNRKLLWERKEKKKYTYAQLREILGEEFEVVG